MRKFFPFQLFFVWLLLLVGNTIHVTENHQQQLSPLQFHAKPRPRVLLPPGLPARTLNADPFYQKWSDPQKIPVEIDGSYTLQELQLIRGAMSQIESDTKNCVKFIPYDPVNRTDFLSVTPLEDAGSLRFGCWSFPGRVFNQKGRGQFIGITRGPRGCAANQREIMKVFVHALGFRMVQNRPDRDRYIKINYEFMAPEWRIIDPYRKYLDSQVFYRNLPFDFYSVTFHNQSKFAKSADQHVYDPLEPDVTIGTEPVLSRWDCVGIATMYGCNPNICEDPYGNDEIPRRTTTITIPSEPDFDDGATLSTFAPFSTQSMRPLPDSTTEITIFLPTQSTQSVTDLITPFGLSTGTPNSIATQICRPTFRVDAAVYSENGKVYLFSDQHFWTMDFRGEIMDAGIPIMQRFGGRVQPPVHAAWSNGSATTIIDATRQEIITRNEQFVGVRPSLHPKKFLLNDAFTFNLTSGAVTYYITNNGTEIQMGQNGNSSKISDIGFLVGLGNRIDAAFTIPILGTQIVGMFANSDFTYVTPCTLDFAPDPNPCFASLPVGGWPLPFSSLVSYPAGGCRRRIRLRFPQFRRIK